MSTTHLIIICVTLIWIVALICNEWGKNAARRNGKVEAAGHEIASIRKEARQAARAENLRRSGVLSDSGSGVRNP